MSTCDDGSVPFIDPEGYVWQVHEDYQWLRPVLEAGWQQHAVLIKQNMRRAVYHITGTTYKRSLYFKCDQPKSPRDHIKSLWRCKAQKEYGAGRRLLSLGVPTIEYVAWAANGTQSIVVSAAEEVVGTPMQLWTDTEALRPLLLPAIVELFRRIRISAVWHPDLHDGNIVVVQHGDALQLRLLDVYGICFQTSLTQQQCTVMAGWAYPILDALDCSQAYDILNAIGLATSHAETETAIDRVRSYVIGRMLHKWPGRRRRFLKDNSSCERVICDTKCWVLLRPFALDVAEHAVAAHKERTVRGELMLKEDRKRCLSRLSIDGHKLIVKEFKAFRIALLCHATRSWLNTHRLGWLGLPAPTALALLRTRGRTCLILEDTGEQLLHSELRDAEQSSRRLLLLEVMAQLLARAHLAGVLHHDMKLSNIVLRNPGDDAPQLVMIDLDRVSFKQRLSPTDRLKNLHQILLSMPPSVTNDERLEFLARYRRHARLPAPELESQKARLQESGLLDGPM